MYYINYIIDLRGFVMMKRFVRCLEIKRLRNKCAIVCVGKKVLSLGGESKRSSETSCACERGLNNVGNNLNPSSTFQPPSSKVARGKKEVLKENNFTDTDFLRFTSRFSLKRAAFTLAEVLVTLGIIGVVSAMTVPTLMQNYQRQSYVTQLHKNYNEMSQALLRYQTDKNAINLSEAGFDSTTPVSGYNFFKTYFKVVADCNDSFTPCMATTYKKLDGNTVSLNAVNSVHKCFTIASGSSICAYKGARNVIQQFAVDTNGQKGPNIFGRDIFLLYFYNDGTIDDLVTTCTEDNSNCGVWDGTASPPTKEEREDVFNKACNIGSNKNNYHGCFGKILNDNWQMTY